MNVYDSQRMADALGAEGYVETTIDDDADMVLLNTCHIREKAAEKVYSELGRLRKRCATSAAPRRDADRRRRLRRPGRGRGDHPPRAGCRFRHRSADLSPPAAGVAAKARKGRKVVETDYAIEDKFEHLPAPGRAPGPARGVTAFLTVQEGCDKFCTFCVVPYTRGAEVSRPSPRSSPRRASWPMPACARSRCSARTSTPGMARARTVREWGLGQLLHELAKIDGLDRLRYTTSHPRDMDDALIAAHRDLDILMPYLHLPVQAGSDRILKAMNRKHTADEYRRLVDRIREARPDIALSGDFIVGFPGETGADFEDTMRLIRDIGYAQAFSFKYSPRPGTPGADLDDQVAEDVKTRTAAPAAGSARTNSRRLHEKGWKERTISGASGEARTQPGQLVGRSPWLQPVVCDETVGKIGDIVDVRISRASANSLIRGKQGSGTDRLERKSQCESRQPPAPPIWRISS
jgi:tRNA-2-methylthio-N6-dimethylallyladenosine synthase